MKLFSLNKNKRRWYKYYRKDEREVETPDMSLYQYLYNSNLNRMNNIAINYFNNRVSDKNFFFEI